MADYPTFDEGQLARQFTDLLAQLDSFLERVLVDADVRQEAAALIQRVGEGGGKLFRRGRACVETLVAALERGSETLGAAAALLAEQRAEIQRLKAGKRRRR